MHATPALGAVHPRRSNPARHTARLDACPRAAPLTRSALLEIFNTEGDGGTKDTEREGFARALDCSLVDAHETRASRTFRSRKGEISVLRIGRSSAIDHARTTAEVMPGRSPQTSAVCKAPAMADERPQSALVDLPSARKTRAKREFSERPRGCSGEAKRALWPLVAPSSSVSKISRRAEQVCARWRTAARVRTSSRVERAQDGLKAERLEWSDSK